MKYFVQIKPLSEDMTIDCIIIHTENCSTIDNSQKKSNLKGPFENILSAENFALKYDLEYNKIECCKKCKPKPRLLGFLKF